MMAELKWFLMSMVLFWSHTDVNGYQLILNDNGPITSGSTISVNATVTNDEGTCITGDKLIFKYQDDAFPAHQNETSTSNCTAIFPITFETIGSSRYRYEIHVLKSLLPFINRPIISGRGELTVTDTLNGQLQLFQNSTVLNKNSAQITYVSTQIETVHKIEINAPDLNFLKNTNSSIFVYWFVDCIYQGNTTDYTFSSNYTQPDLQHEILGIVVASEKNKTIANTTIAPSTLTNITNTVSTATSPTTNSTITTTASPKTETSSSIIINSTYTADCKQKNPLDFLLSVVQLEISQKYGYFNRSILVKDPVTNVKTQGKVWIQEGEMLELQWSCNGSGPFRFCVRYQAGPYNVTGNETCTWEKNLLQCQMQFRHYFHEPTNYTLIVIMANDVSKLVIPIGINIYKVQKHPQISVIVVPVTFSSIAVVIIVFGIAYYFQNKSRFLVEVADFDFANNSDMECKTFRERLRDAISQAINRTHDYSEYDGSEEQVGSLATTQNQKYGSMQ